MYEKGRQREARISQDELVDAQDMLS